MTAMWVAVIVAAFGCYILKLCGVSLPQRVLEKRGVQSVAALLPVAMLAALVTVDLFDHANHYALDWRVLLGVVAGLIALLLRRGLLVVFVVAVAVTALLRLT